MSNTYHGIYAIINNATNDMYVGSTADILTRLKCHRMALIGRKHSNAKLQSAFNKYGEENFSFIVIERVFKKEHLVKREQYWIDYYESINDYNLCPEADSLLGFRHSDNSREKMSMSKRGRTAWNLGKHLSKEHKKSLSKAWKNRGEVSEETRRKISKAHAGKKLSEELKKKLSELRKGKPGHPHSKKTKRKMSISHKGLPSNRLGSKLTEWHKQRISESLIGNTHMLGKKLTKAQRKKISVANKKSYDEGRVGYWKGKVSPKKGIPLSSEMKEKLSQAHLGIPLSRKHREGMKKAWAIRKEKNKLENDAIQGGLIEEKG